LNSSRTSAITVQSLAPHLDPFYSSPTSATTNVFSSFLTPLTSCKANKVGTLVFTLTIGIMHGVSSSMMPKVPKYGIGTSVGSKRDPLIKAKNRVGAVKPSKINRFF